MSDRVAVIGCGLMGSSLARALAGAGHEVIGHDLDRSRLEQLAEHRVTPAESLREAVERAALVIVNVPTYENVSQVFDDGSIPADAWAGRTVVNLVSGTPDDARACARLVDSRGAVYLEGAIFSYPRDIGTAESLVLFSGPSGSWQRFGSTLKALGPASEHVSEDVAAAKAVDVAMAGAFYSVALGSFAEAAAYLLAQGIELRTALLAARREADQIRADIDDAIEAITAEDYSTDQATLDVFLEAVDAWRTSMTASGQRAELIGALADNLRRAHDAGFGEQSFFAQIQTMSDESAAGRTPSTS